MGGPGGLGTQKGRWKMTLRGYRKLNLITKADPYPIPRIEDMIDDIGQASYITALDLTKGYWQVPVAKASQEKTAFITAWGKYQFVTMPFVWSTFQRLMDQLLKGTQMFAAAYLDDVIIRSRCWEEHLEYLRKILTRLRKAGLTRNQNASSHVTNVNTSGILWEMGRYTLCRPKYKPYRILLSPLRRNTSVRSWVSVGIITVSFQTFPLLQPP